MVYTNTMNLKRAFKAQFPTVRNNVKEPNPVQVRRELLGLSQESLAVAANVSRPLIMRIEQGLITGVSWAVLSQLHSHSSDKAQLKDDYDAWRVAVRLSNIHYVRWIVESADDLWSGDWKALRLCVNNSHIGFCKLYCIHPQVLSTFEKVERDRLTPYMETVFGEELADKMNVKMGWRNAIAG